MRDVVQRFEFSQISFDDVSNALDGLRLQAMRGIDAFAQVGDGVFAAKLTHTALRIDVGNEHAARDRTDIDCGDAANRQERIAHGYCPTPKNLSRIGEYQVSG